MLGGVGEGCLVWSMGTAQLKCKTVEVTASHFWCPFIQMQIYWKYLHLICYCLRACYAWAVPLCMWHKRQLANCTNENQLKNVKKKWTNANNSAHSLFPINEQAVNFHFAERSYTNISSIKCDRYKCFFFYFQNVISCRWQRHHRHRLRAYWLYNANSKDIILLWTCLIIYTSNKTRTQKSWLVLFMFLFLLRPTMFLF